MEIFSTVNVVCADVLAVRAKTVLIPASTTGTENIMENEPFPAVRNAPTLVPPNVTAPACFFAKPDPIHVTEVPGGPDLGYVVIVGMPFLSTSECE